MSGNHIAKHRHAAFAWGPALAKAMESSRNMRTQKALAKKSGIAQSTIGRILRGEVDPQSYSLQRIAEAFRIPLATFLDVTQVESLVSGQKQDVGHTGGAYMNCNEQIERALRQALACREDRKRAQAALDALRRKEEEAVEHLQGLVREHDAGKAP